MLLIKEVFDMNNEKNNRALLRELMRKTEKQRLIEDAYSAAYIEDTEDEDFMTAAEQGFMLGYIS